jgi:2-phosphosulfolactate phosphatase
MRLKVDLLPRGPYADVVLVVDVLRATTTAPLLFERGLETLFVTPSLKAARAYAAEGGHLLLGERDGLPPEGFNYGASPADLSQVDFSGRTAVMTTQNGPRTLPVVQDARVVLLGSFYNARAAAEAAVELARDEVGVVCAGHEGNESLEDTLAAGFLARRIERALEARDGAEPLELRDAARLAIALLRAFPDPQEALVQSVAGRILARLGLHEDLAHASLISQTAMVPVLREVLATDAGPIYRFEPHRPGVARTA